MAVEARQRRTARAGRRKTERDVATASRVRLHLSILAAAVILVYSSSLRGVFILDDHESIPENSTIRSLWPLWRCFLPPERTTVAGRPFLNFTFALNYAISGTQTWSYHVFNLLIHCGAALFAYGVIRRTLLSPRMRERYASAAGNIALACVLVWAVHPLATEAVTYVVQRSESLIGLLLLGVFYLTIRGAEASRPWKWYAPAVILSLLGMCTKEVMVTAPVLLLLYDRIFLADSWAAVKKQRWGLYASLAATWIVLIFVSAGGRMESAGFGLAEATPLQYFRTQLGVVAHYLRLCFVPAPLLIDYLWPIASGWGSVLLPGLPVMLFGIATLILLIRRPEYGFWGVWFFVILSPSSSIVPVVTEVAAERRMYLPLLGVVFLVVLLVSWGLRRWMRGDQRRTATAGAALLGSVALVLGCMSFVRNTDYYDAERMWLQVLKHRPQNARAQYNLGYLYEAQGRNDEAVQRYRETSRLKPDYVEAYSNLGLLLMRMARYSEADEAFTKALKFKPAMAQLHQNYGMSLTEQGRRDEAYAEYKEALRLSPHDAGILYNMGNLLAEMGRNGEAVSHYRKVLELEPGFYQARMNLSQSLSQLGKRDEAVAELRLLVKQHPDYVKGHYGLGVLLAGMGKTDEARGCFDSALRVDPAFAPAQEALQRLK